MSYRIPSHPLEMGCKLYKDLFYTPLPYALVYELWMKERMERLRHTASGLYIAGLKIEMLWKGINFSSC
jgi:hypothetical protein